VIAQVYGVAPPLIPITWLYGVPTTPFGRLIDVSVSDPGATTVTLTGPLILCCGVELSVTCTVSAAVPTAIGVPLITQVPGVRTRPAGSTPEVMLQLYGTAPPLTPIVALYTTPNVPFGRLVDVRINDPGVTIVRLSVPLTLSCGIELSVTLTVRFVTPAAVGVPLIVHVFAVRLRPAGNTPPPMLHRYGPVPPITSITALYGNPIVPFGRLVNGKLNATGATTSVTVPDAVCFGVPESVTPTVNVPVPATVGVPLITHPPAPSVNPAGNVPAVMLQI
jgi:hypothetical protein